MSVTGTNISLTLRNVKGSELTYSELDNNQSNLKTGIENHSHGEFSLTTHNHNSAYDASGAASAVQSNLDTHAGLSTSAHGGIISNTDSRLTDARPASDVSAWAKAATKPTYTYIEVGAAPSLGSDDNYMTDAEKVKLSGIADGAEVNVNADWNAVGGDAEILNKPATYAPSSHTTGSHSDWPAAVSMTEVAYLDGVTSSIQTQLSEKQSTLVSGTNIKTINSTSLLGSGNIAIAAASSPHGFFKADFASVAFVKTGAGTISVKAGTSALVNATTVSWATQTDITMPSHTIGVDYSIYACADGSIRADANATAPTGYDTTNSRKIGGYHYGRVRNTLTVTDVATEIVPRSLWDLTYRPKCNPAGMVDVHGNGSLWADIYLVAVDSAITLTSGVVTAGTCKSIYNGTPLSGTEGLNGYNFIELAKNSGKRLLTHSEWLAVAHGSPQGNNGDNLNAWSATTNVARTDTGQVARAVSFCGATDCAGNLWEWLDEWSNDYSLAVAANFYSPMAGQNVGQQYLYNSTGLRMYLAGGFWTNGVIAGSRALLVNSYPWYVLAYIGSRFACDGL